MRRFAVLGTFLLTGGCEGEKPPATWTEGHHATMDSGSALEAGSAMLDASHAMPDAAPSDSTSPDAAPAPDTDAAWGPEASVADASDGSSPVAVDAGSLAPTPVVWLKGDLHLHSSHSDDAMDNPVDTVIARAEDTGLDYFVFTDHDNHVMGNITTWNDPLYRSDRMIMLYGVEYTTDRAHMNFFSTTAWDHAPLWALRDGEPSPTWTKRTARGSTRPSIIPSTAILGSTRSISTTTASRSGSRCPRSRGTPKPSHSGTRSMLAGRKIAGRGGSDCHHQEQAEALAVNVATPTTWIRASERTGPALLRALREGRVSIAGKHRVHCRWDWRSRQGSSASPTPSSSATRRREARPRRPAMGATRRDSRPKIVQGAARAPAPPVAGAAA